MTFDPIFVAIDLVAYLVWFEPYPKIFMNHAWILDLYFDDS